MDQALSQFFRDFKFEGALVDTITGVTSRTSHSTGNRVTFASTKTDAGISYQLYINSKLQGQICTTNKSEFRTFLIKCGRDIERARK